MKPNDFATRVTRCWRPRSSLSEIGCGEPFAMRLLYWKRSSLTARWNEPYCNNLDQQQRKSTRGQPETNPVSTLFAPEKKNAAWNNRKQQDTSARRGGHHRECERGPGIDPSSAPIRKEPDPHRRRRDRDNTCQQRQGKNDFGEHSCLPYCACTAILKCRQYRPTYQVLTNQIVECIASALVARCCVPRGLPRDQDQSASRPNVEDSILHAPPGAAGRSVGDVWAERAA